MIIINHIAKTRKYFKKKKYYTLPSKYLILIKIQTFKIIYNLL